MKKRVFIIISGIIGSVLLCILLLLITLTVTEYRPADIEKTEVSGAATKELRTGDTLTVMSWNVGYGALGDNADFFMDGGTHVSTSTEERVRENLSAISQTIQDADPDVILLQEVDTDSKRSYYINEAEYFCDSLEGYQDSFAYNYRCLYVPYPIPTIGKVNAGIMTLGRYPMTQATRIQLPCPFQYPMRVCNLKRCLMVNRIPLVESDKELVVVNLHLEAYDDGEGKALQLSMLKDVLQKEAEAGNYVIAGGDFNQSFSNADTEKYAVRQEGIWEAGIIDVEEFGDDFDFWMDSEIPTCRLLNRPYAGSDVESFQYYMLDGFIVSANIVVEKVETLDTGFYATDHNPITMEVKLQ